jgi:hypothetical protein
MSDDLIILFCVVFELAISSTNDYIKGLGLQCLMPLTTIFQLYLGSQF